MNKRIAKKVAKRNTKSSLNKDNIRLKKQILMLDQMISDGIKINWRFEDLIQNKTEEIAKMGLFKRIFA